MRFAQQLAEADFVLAVMHTAFELKSLLLGFDMLSR